MNKLKKINKKNLLKLSLILISILFALPSIVYLAKHKTIFQLNNQVENMFFLNDNFRTLQAIIFMILILFLFVFYFLIIKNRKKLFKSEKEIFVYILLVSIIFIIVTPFLASDIIYYLGIGRLNSTYYQNPYYVTIHDFFKENTFSSFHKDTAFLGGCYNYWSDTTVVYGPIWTIICAIIAKMSCGSIDIGVYLFKIFNLIAHMLNCYLLYKLSNKKKIFPLIYGLNPFILIQGITNVHNDIVLLLFTLLSLYFLLKKKKLLISLFLLSLATNIKFITILFLPYFIIYYFREEKVSKRFVECLKYGMIFAIMYIIPYLIYMEDLSIFTCMLVQRDRFGEGMYSLLLFITNSTYFIDIMKNILLILFAIYYVIKCIKLLFKEKICWNYEMKNMFNFLLLFIFLLLTNFQTWYLSWFFMVFIWQTSMDMKLIVEIQFSSLFAYSIFIKMPIVEKNSSMFLIIMLSIITIGILLEYYRKSKRLLKENN